MNNRTFTKHVEILKYGSQTRLTTSHLEQMSIPDLKSHF